MQINLNENWIMRREGKEFSCNVPCSVYKVLIEQGEIPDPYYRENEYISTQICGCDCEFEKHFIIDDDKASMGNVVLKFECIDTIANVYLNGEELFYADNMHCSWEFPVCGRIRIGDNVLIVKIKSPNKYIAEMDEKRHLWGVDSTMIGYPHIRKAHCMFGWDWGPKLPDMGIYRNVTLNFYSGGRIKDVYYSQKHKNGLVTLCCCANLDIRISGAKLKLTVTSPDGEKYTSDISDGYAEIEIKNPKLWWIRGYGEQPLYNCTVDLIDASGNVLDSYSQRIGLRTLTISQDKDEWGEEFCFISTLR